jgi:hypothetical protein
MKTRFEKDYEEAKHGNGIEILSSRKTQLEVLRRQFKSCRNTFKRDCLKQEITRLEEEYKKIDELF